MNENKIKITRIFVLLMLLLTSIVPVMGTGTQNSPSSEQKGGGTVQTPQPIQTPQDKKK